MTDSWNLDASETPPPAEEVLAHALAKERLDVPDPIQRKLFGFNSSDRRSRPFNLLRSQVLKIAKANGWKTIGITSATPDVGKTFTASNLAASMSRIPDQYTLLFDLDLRRSSIGKCFGLEEGPGIADYLTGGINTLDGVGRNVTGSGLIVFPAGEIVRNSAELLAGTRMKSLVEAMGRLGDDCFCLCDLPPAFANDDASIVVQQIDAYLLVIEEGKTTARQVRDAIEVLSPAPCIGTVLNRYHGPIGGDEYGFGYWTQRYYDAYYQE
ncbi:MAG: CpsD/CapB family tyrosine-protein kinase [Sphingomonas bacterium]